MPGVPLSPDKKTPDLLVAEHVNQLVQNCLRRIRGAREPLRGIAAHEVRHPVALRMPTPWKGRPMQLRIERTVQERHVSRPKRSITSDRLETRNHLECLARKD